MQLFHSKSMHYAQRVQSPVRTPPAVPSSSVPRAPTTKRSPIASAPSAMPASGSTKLMNSPDTLVQNALDGLIMQHPHLTKLDGFPDLKVILNKEHDKSKNVSVIAGDRLHFGLAAEQAKAEGLKVEMVPVGDDLAIDEPGLAGRRGIAGTILVNKVAGAVAQTGAPMEQVVDAAKKAAAACGTMGVALRVCTLPGKPPSDRIKEGEMEVGLGIHGEPGASTTTAMPAKDIVKLMIDKMYNSSFFQLKIKVERCYVGPYMTSVDMSGASLTVMRLPAGKEGDDMLALLDAPSTTAGWLSAGHVADISPVPLPPGSRQTGPTTKRPDQLTPYGTILDKAIRAAATSLIEASKGLDELDTKGKAESPGPKEFAPALRAAVEAMQKYGGARAGSRTMLDAWLPACEALEEVVAKGETNGAAAADAAAAAAEKGAEATKGMKAAAGRSSYVPAEVLASVPDPGAVAVSIWMRNVANALK
ncbi:hypothetical protein DUNSADRAFT_9392 [Dunaliella salina]|uniref:DhaK domain-containing protein n=1 Tax=Dunaliella salina TaxID=3046 RepID=A0ABQ7GHJ2_DUNSA|nr:hypothetical protein DUNSADRAFT_9392 [Dunaliella salina]|eukprot:KAF5834078.1 hypothetical protein DUNSADRAFT_9392 [Dunaliella salina]